MVNFKRTMMIMIAAVLAFGIIMPVSAQDEPTTPGRRGWVFRSPMRITVL